MMFKVNSGIHQCWLYYYDFMIFINIISAFVRISTKQNKRTCDEATCDKLPAHTADSLYPSCRPGTALNDAHTFSHFVFQQPYQQR